MHSSGTSCVFSLEKSRTGAKEGDLQMHVHEKTNVFSHLFSLWCFSQSGILDTYLKAK